MRFSKGCWPTIWLAFQVERDRRNFLAAVRDAFGLDTSHGIDARANGRATHVIAVPIGVDFDPHQRGSRAISTAGRNGSPRREFRPSRRRPPAIVARRRPAGLHQRHPRASRRARLAADRASELRSRLVFLQVGVPSRSKLESYAPIERAIDEKIAAINTRHGRGPADGPIRYRKSALKLRRLVALYRLCGHLHRELLHDGMNLVAKEFVAARRQSGRPGAGGLAGAALERRDAVIINPYDRVSFGRAIERAIVMPRDERSHACAASTRPPDMTSFCGREISTAWSG